MSTCLIKECSDILGLVSHFVACQAIPCYHSCTAMLTCSQWSTWPVGSWTFCCQMSTMRGVWWAVRRLSGHRAWCKYILKIIIIARYITVIWWCAGKSGWVGRFMNGWQMPGLLWSGGIPTVWSNQEWIVHASWSVSHYNQRNRIRLVLPLTARCLWSDRSSSRSCIIVCATNIISFRILKLWECVPGIWKASICCEPFSKIVGTTLATAVAFQVKFEWFAQGVCGSVFLGWQGIVVCCMGW